MRVLVCGGRNFWDWKLLDDSLAMIYQDTPITCIIEGGAQGADRLARKFAHVNGITLETYPAQWSEHGKAAGPIRNQQMIDQGNPDLVVAFPGGKGTADMCRRAIEAGIKIWQVT